MRELTDFDEDATDGQIADWFGAMESDDFGEWASETEETFCPKCDPPFVALHGAMNEVGRRKK